MDLTIHAFESTFRVIGYPGPFKPMYILKTELGTNSNSNGNNNNTRASKEEEEEPDVTLGILNPFPSEQSSRELAKRGLYEWYVRI